MGNTLTAEAKAWMARAYPPGTRPDKRKILTCSDPKLWYANKIGKIITVHYFATFGAYDTKGRWIWYYDLSGPLNKVIKWPSKVAFIGVVILLIVLCIKYFHR